MGKAANDPDATGYEIRIQGYLDRRWIDPLDGLTMRFEPDGTTVISAPAADQASLHGLLQRVRDLALPLVSVNRIERDHA